MTREHIGVQSYELYAMREVPEADRGRNGLYGFTLSHSPACIDVDSCTEDFTATAMDKELAPAYYESCTLGGDGLTCS